MRFSSQAISILFTEDDKEEASGDEEKEIVEE